MGGGWVQDVGLEPVRSSMLLLLVAVVVHALWGAAGKSRCDGDRGRRCGVVVVVMVVEVGDVLWCRRARAPGGMRV